MLFTFITNIPDSVITIYDADFHDCCNLQNILISKKCSVSDVAFEGCDSLGGIIYEEGQDWVKFRFDTLPLHHLCNSNDVSVGRLAQITIYDPLVLSLDAMCMSSLHILSCNSHSTLPMIRELASNFPVAALVKNQDDMYPIDMYMITKVVVSFDLCTKNDDDEDDDDEEWGERSYTEHRLLSYWLRKSSDDCYLHKMIKYSCCHGLTYDLMEVLLAFEGLSMDAELKKPDRVTGLCPFMTAATSSNRSLDFVYELAMMTDPTVIMKE
jgi:hypothetical protein